MGKLTASVFAQALHKKFHETRRRSQRLDTSHHLFPLLREIAEEHGLWWAGRKAGSADPRHGEAREYLWDFTMYKAVAKKRPADAWNLPCVVVEHENLHGFAAFRFDHWKTLLSRAPLRVAIGYVSKTKAKRRGEWVEAINETSVTDAWDFPPNTEDLIALGYFGMTKADNFEFWWRHGNNRQWTELAVPSKRV